MIRILTLGAALTLAAPLFAQQQNCGLPAGAGGTLSASGGNVAPGSQNPDPGFSGESSGLSFTQFLYINPDDLVFDTLSGTNAPRILFADNDGRADPAADLGLAIGDRFCVQSMSFSLDVLQRQIDTLYTSSFFGVPCCDFAEVSQGVDVCSLMQDAGILAGADLEDYNDLADFAVAYGIQASLESIFFLVDSFINIVPPGSPCTAGAPLCYATSNRLCYTVDTVSTVGGPLAWEAGAELLPNPARGVTTLRFRARSAGEGVLRVHDALGRRLRERRLALAPGANALTLDLDGLAPGLYPIAISGPQGRASLTLVVE